MQQDGLITGVKIADAVLGFFFVVLTFLLGGIGVLAVPVTYLIVHRKYKAFAMGLGIGLLVAVVLALGAVVACLSSLKNL